MRKEHKLELKVENRSGNNLSSSARHALSMTSAANPDASGQVISTTSHAAGMAHTSLSQAAAPMNSSNLQPVMYAAPKAVPYNAPPSQAEIISMMHDISRMQTVGQQPTHEYFSAAAAGATPVDAVDKKQTTPDNLDFQDTAAAPPPRFIRLEDQRPWCEITSLQNSFPCTILPLYAVL